VRRRCHGGPARFFRDKEDVFRQIFVTVIFKAFPFRQERLEFPFKGAGDVTQENQADDDFTVVRGWDVPPQFAGGVPYLFFKANVGVIFSAIAVTVLREGGLGRMTERVKVQGRRRSALKLGRVGEFRSGPSPFLRGQPLIKGLWLSPPR